MGRKLSLESVFVYAFAAVVFSCFVGAALILWQCVFGRCPQ